jgi:hypothetical protein
MYTKTSRHDCGASGRIPGKLPSVSPASTASIQAGQITHDLALRAAYFPRSATRARFNTAGELL